MSLIHKALQKSESEKVSEKVDLFDEGDGSQKPSLRSQLNARSLTLIGIMILALAFAIYRNISIIQKKRAARQTPAPISYANPSAVNNTASAASVPAQQEQGGEMSDPSDWPSDIKKLVDKSSELIQSGQYDGAIQNYQSILTTVGLNAMILNNMGFALKSRGDFAEAEKKYAQAVEVDPNCSECWNNFGLLKVEMKNNFEAVRCLKKAVEIDPTYADPHFNLAVLYEDEGNYKSAINEYKAWLEYTSAEDQALLQNVRYRIEELAN